MLIPLSSAGDESDQPACAHIEHADDDAHDHQEYEHDQGIIDQRALGGPGDLPELMIHIVEGLADLLEEIGEPRVVHSSGKNTHDRWIETYNAMFMNVSNKDNKNNEENDIPVNKDFWIKYKESRIDNELKMFELNVSVEILKIECR